MITPFVGTAWAVSDDGLVEGFEIDGDTIDGQHHGKPGLAQDSRVIPFLEPYNSDRVDDDKSGSSAPGEDLVFKGSMGETTSERQLRLVQAGGSGVHSAGRKRQSTDLVNFWIGQSTKGVNSDHSVRVTSGWAPERLPSNGDARDHRQSSTRPSSKRSPYPASSDPDTTLNDPIVLPRAQRSVTCSSQLELAREPALQRSNSTIQDLGSRTKSVGYQGQPVLLRRRTGNVQVHGGSWCTPVTLDACGHVLWPSTTRPFSAMQARHMQTSHVHRIRDRPVPAS